MKNKRGFTLIELIIVIAVIAILVGAIFVAIDPARRLHEASNARRRSDVATVLDALKKYQADNDGTHYSTVAALTAGNYYLIGTTATATCDITCGGQTTETSCLNLSAIPSNYLANVPIDPKDGTDADTGYMLMIDTNGAVTVYACDPEGEGSGGSGTAPTISITR